MEQRSEMAQANEAGKVVQEATPADTAQLRETAEWTPRHWKRSLRVAFAAWAPPTGDNDRGIEIKVWAGGIRAAEEGF